MAYIPHGPGVQASPDWGEVIMMKNLIANASKDVEITPVYEIEKTPVSAFDLIFHHNLASTAMFRRRWVRGGSWLERKLGHPIPALYGTRQDMYDALDVRPRIIGGIRGYNGLHKAQDILKYFDAIHVNNNDLKERVLNYGARQAHVLYPGVDLDLFKPMPELRPDTFTVGWSGDVGKNVKNWHLIKSLGYPFKMATKQRFIPHAEMPEFYNSLDVYVSFSSSEGWGRGIIEAMACGLPVVCSNAGASEILSPEWVVDGDPRHPGWLPRFKHRVEVLRQTPNLRESVGHENRAQVKPWGWPTITREFERICRQVVNG